MSVRSHRRVTPVQHNHAVCRAAYAPHPHRAKRSGLDRVLCGSDVPCPIRRIEDSSVKKGAMLRSRRDGPGSSGASVSHREPSRPASSTNQRQASCGRPRRSSFRRAPRRLSLAGTITPGAPRRDRAIGNFASFSNIAHLLAAIGCGSGERNGSAQGDHQRLRSRRRRGDLNVLRQRGSDRIGAAFAGTAHGLFVRVESRPLRQSPAASALLK